MAIILPIASGKGGVGKSVFAINCAVALAKLGKTTVLIDLDLGASNLHTLLGIKNRYPGIGNLINRTETCLEALLIETDILRLFFIPGDTLLPGTANIDFFTKQKIMKSITNLPADYILLDLGAGSSYNTVDFFLTSSSGCIVTMGESTAILNAYSFLKTVFYRTLIRSFPPKGPERQVISNFFAQKMEGTSNTSSVLKKTLLENFGENAQQAISVVERLYPRIVLNMGTGPHDLGVGIKLREIAKKNLELNVEYIGYIPWDSSVSASVTARKPAILLQPDSPFAQAIQAIAGRLISEPIPTMPHLYPDNEDLKAVYLS
ncbi:P-loop NTPase [Gracilinema caldarium]|uniref:Cobyrinic acid ac-diamide synthase n=1 Tax=Gracilinema caldarium (strain ATCC 51460 / DSM 7334 / H1) TaxID=744872 RepID=F8F1F3_GRAC1|nr:P-loop NTPase [Gracilinema caldarium]AEJ19006.1 cobyrinic acid ac-diamide synthase [Gracilinema caldarium DSM 7334]